jgi:rRNA maturation RNase YbeY
MKKTYYYLDDIKCTLSNKRGISATIEFLVHCHNKKIDRINVILTNNENLYKINLNYLQHNTYTDIITFDYSERGAVSGDLYISVEMVKENAKNLEISFQKELERVIFHGILHLLGYKDKTEEEKKFMRKEENRTFHRLGRIMSKRRKFV